MSKLKLYRLPEPQYLFLGYCLGCNFVFCCYTYFMRMMRKSCECQDELGDILRITEVVDEQAQGCRIINVELTLSQKQQQQSEN